MDTSLPFVRQLVTAMYRDGVPAWLIAHVFNVTVPKLKYAIAKLELGPPKIVNRGFFWTIDLRAYRMSDPQRSRFRNGVMRRVRSDTERACSVTLQGDDLHPVDAIESYRAELPALVFRELFGMNEKLFERVCRRLGASVSASKNHELSRMLLSGDDFVEFFRLSDRQNSRVRDILDSHRQRNQRALEERRINESEALWSRLIAARESAIDSAKPFPCRGTACKMRSGDIDWTWPRCSEFFHADHSSPGGLCYYCRYCARIRQIERGPYQSTRQTKTLKPAEVKRIGAILKRLGKRVPTAYLLAAFNLTTKQLSRIRAERKVPKKPSGSTIIHRWRTMDDADCPALDLLSLPERRALLAAWRADKTAWRRELEKEEKTLLKMMRDEEAHIERSDPAMKRKGRVRCRGGCGKRWYQSTILFPPTYRRCHGFCRFCNNRALRKKS